MKKLLIFPLSFILCLSLIMPVKAQDHFQLLFKGFADTDFLLKKHFVRKVGNYYFTHNKNLKLCYGTNKKHLKVIDQDTVEEILTNGKVAYYVKAHIPNDNILQYQIIKLDLATGQKSIMWSSKQLPLIKFTLKTVAYKNGLLYFYYEPQESPNAIGIYNIETNQLTNQCVNKVFLNGNGTYFTAFNGYPWDTAILPIYLYDQNFKKITKLTQSTQYYTKFIGNDLYYDYTTRKKENFYHTIMKYNLKTHKRTKLCRIDAVFGVDSELQILDYGKNNVTILYDYPYKMKRIAYHKRVVLKKR